MLFSKMLSAAVLLSAAAVSQAQVVVNGYYAASANLVRQTSNANQALNLQFTRTFNPVIGAHTYVFVNEMVNVTTGNGTISQFLPTTQITRAVVSVSTSPFPNAVTTKSTTTIGATTGFTFTQTAAAAVFPTALEYNEVNGVDGFQAGADTVVQMFDLKENLGTYVAGTSVNWQPLTTSTEMWPSTNGKNATVTVVKSCNAVNGFCVTFRFSNMVYTRNGVTYMPDAVKIDILANTANFNTTNGRLAILSHMLATKEALNLTDMHTAVDNTVAQANAVKGTAVVSADFMFAFNSNNTNAAYVNFARTATQTSAAGVNTTVTVNAQVVANATVNAMVNSMVNVDYANQAATIGSNFASMTQVKAVVYSFLADNNGAKSINWDPEVGTANVNTTNMVVGGSTGLSAGAIAGIVIAVLGVAGVAGFFGYRAMKNRNTKNGPLLAMA